MSLDVWVVDDDETFRERLARTLRSHGHQARCARDGSDALESIQARSPDVAFIDLRMPGGSGLELLKTLRLRCPETRVIMLTGYGSIATAVEATRAGAAGYLQKPSSWEEIRAALDLSSEPRLPVAEPATPSLASVEWEHIQRVLSDCKGNVSAAAQRLGIDRRTLQRKLQKYAPNG